MSAPLLAVDGLTVSFRSRDRWLPAVRAVDFRLAPGTAMALVGESGSGKSATVLAIMGLLGPAARTAGRVLLDGSDLLSASPRTLRAVRANRIAMVFQDPQSSLNPVMTVETQLTETLRAHRRISRAAARTRALELLRAAELTDPEGRLQAYPHELSGGMRQRVMLAIALACDPELLIADEPTTALDITVQAQILDTLDRRRRELGMAMLLITHDLGVANRLCERIAVMYGGRIVEEGATRAILDHPRHPYTVALLSAQPALSDHATRLTSIEGSPPSLVELARPGCSFAPRCPRAVERCRAEEPALVTDADGALACFQPVHTR